MTFQSLSIINAARRAPRASPRIVAIGGMRGAGIDPAVLHVLK